MSEIDQLKERIITLLRAVGHVGVDFGHGKYQLGSDEIEEARKLYAELTSDNAQPGALKDAGTSE